MKQPLDANIIANWKVKYKNKLLRFVCSRVDGKKNASEIVKLVNVSMAVERGKQGSVVRPDCQVLQKNETLPRRNRRG